MRSFVVPLMAVALCACASTAPGDMTPSVQNAVYVVGEGTPQTQAMTTAETQPSADAQPSKLLRLYWYFAGR